MRPLDEIDPRAPLLVMTNLSNRECGLAYGCGLQMNWDHSGLQSISPLTNAPDGWYKIQCPDDRVLLVKFLNPSLRFLGEINQPEPEKPKRTMPTAPAKKGAPAPKPATKPAAAPAAKPTKAPVKPAADGEGKKADAKSPTRSAFKDLTVAKSIAKATADGVLDDMGPKATKFLTEFIEAGVSKDYAWLPNRFKAALAAAYKA